VSTIKVLEVLLSIQSVIILTILIKRFRYHLLSSWFIAGWFVFVNSSFLISFLLVGDTSVLYSLPSNYLIVPTTASIETAYYAFFIANTLIILYKDKSEIKVSRLKRSQLEYKIGFVIFCFSGFLVGLESILSVTLGVYKTYSDIYVNGVEVIPLMKIWNTLYGFSIFIILSNLEPKRLPKWFYVILIIIGILQSLGGIRTYFIVPIGFVLWHSSLFYGLKLSKKKAMLTVVVLIFSIAILTSIRTSGSTTTPVSDVIETFSSLSTSVKHLVYYIDMKDELRSDFPYLFAPFIFPFQYIYYGSAVIGQSLSSSLLRLDLNHILSSSININSYYHGAGLGNFFVSESMQYGFVFLVISLFLLKNLLVFYNKTIQKSRVGRGLSYLIFYSVAFAPRSNLFPDLWPVVKILVMLVIFRMILALLRTPSLVVKKTVLSINKK